MRRRRLVWILLIALMITSLISTVTLALGQAIGFPIASDPSDTRPTGVRKIPEGIRPGFYYLNYGSVVLDPAVYPVDGSVRFFQWSELEIDDGVYNWGVLDRFLERMSNAGLAAGIFISTHDGRCCGDIRAMPD